MLRMMSITSENKPYCRVVICQIEDNHGADFRELSSSFIMDVVAYRRMTARGRSN